MRLTCIRDPACVLAIPFAFLAGGWLLASLWFPFGWDQGIGAATGDVILSGGVVYRDAFDMKGPLVYYVFAATQWLFGRHMWTIRVFELALFAAAAPALVGLVTRLASRAAALWCIVVLVFCMSSMTWFHVNQPDTWASLFVLMGLAPLIGRDVLTPGRLFAAGCGVGLAALIKPFFVSLGFVALFLAVDALTNSRSRARALILFVFGCWLPAAIMIGYLALIGALDDAFTAVVLFNLEGYSGIDRLDLLRVIREVAAWLLTGTRRLGPFGGLAALSVVALGAYGLWNRQRRAGIALSLWAVIALACVALQGKFYVYHWVLAVVPIAVLGTFGVYWLMNEGASRPARAMAVITVAVFLMQATPVPLREIINWVKLLSGRDDANRYLARFERFGYNAKEVEEVARYIRERTSPDDTVAAFGYGATINFLAGRRSPTRFLYSMPILLPTNPRRESFRQEFLSDLRRRTPKYFVYGIYAKDPYGVLQGFPELAHLLASDYLLETKIGAYDIYRWRVE